MSDFRELPPARGIQQAHSSAVLPCAQQEFLVSPEKPTWMEHLVLPLSINARYFCEFLIRKAFVLLDWKFLKGHLPFQKVTKPMAVPGLYLIEK